MRLRFLIATLAATMASVTAIGAAPAHAATGWNRCPVNRFCVFTGLNGTGLIGIFANADADLSDNIGPRGLDNKTKAVWDRNSQAFFLYDVAGYRDNHGRHVPFAIVLPGFRGNLLTRDQNRASSLCRAALCPPIPFGFSGPPILEYR